MTPWKDKDERNDIFRKSMYGHACIFFYSFLIIIPSNSFIEEQQQLICWIKENSAKIQILKFLDMANNFNSLKSEYPLL